MRNVWLALACVSACNKAPTTAAGGTIVLSVDSKEPVDHVNIHAYSPADKETAFDFSVVGHDLTKAPVAGEITPGPTIGSGTVMFVGLGYANNVLVASGRAPGEFTPGKRTTAALTLRGGIVDADQDGYSVADGDCNDQSSLQNPFLGEICGDNIDNNCNGSVDEGCPCTDTSRACYTGDPATRGFGVCTDGTQACTNGTWAACQGGAGPAPEQCNDGKDNNCDGSIDEGCPCQEGTQRFCYVRQVLLVGEPVADLNLHGECRAGTQVCIGTAWGSCEGVVQPVPEICDGLDNDCDGAFDNGWDDDGDDYTTCGTRHDSCTPGVPSVRIAGLDPKFKDCDDAKAGVHPCQNNMCAGPEAGLDIACADAAKVCSETDSCASLKYYYGWDPTTPVDTSKNPICDFLGDVFTSQCGLDNVTCTGKSDAATFCSAGSQKGPPSPYRRSACVTATGCGTPTKATAPADGPPIANAVDTFGDCPGVDCSSVYTGTAAATGWSYDPTNQVFVCDKYSGTVLGLCNGSGGCEGVGENCVRQNPSAKAAIAAAPLAACQEPAGYSEPTPGTILSTSCYTDVSYANVPASGNPQSQSAPDNQPDPKQRCPLSGCTGVVSSAWAGGSCTYFSGAGSAQVNCKLGACDDSANGCTTASAPTTTIMCHGMCQIPNSCTAGGKAATTNYCYNANGGTAKPSLCAAGSTCFDSANTGDAADASCQPCLQPYACGPSCVVCSGSTHCMKNSNHNATCTDATDCGCN